MASRSPTHVVILTPPGRGAIATILVAGPAAIDTVSRLFHPASGKRLAQQPVDRIVFGRWGSTAGEELVVARRGDERIEIHCHGGEAAPAAIVASLIAEGCVSMPWREWLRASSADPIAAAAQIALADAHTERTAAILLDQYTGALGRELGEIERLLASGGPRAEIEARIQQLLDSAPLGLHLTRPWQVVIAGPPNVGKSSIVNALVGYQRAIVFDSPGTTRDVVTASTAVDGWPVEISDTAGLRASCDPLEAAGVELAQNRMATADAIVLVFDLSEPWNREHSELSSEVLSAANRAGSAITILVHNKCDLAQPHVHDRPTGLLTSAVTGQGIPDLVHQISRRIVPDLPPPGAAVPFTAEQVAWLSSSRQ